MSASRTAMRRRRQRRDGPRGPVARRSGGRRRILGVLGGILLFFVFVGGAIAAGSALYGFSRYNEIAEGVVPPEQLISEYSSGGARIYDRNGTLLYEFVDPLEGLRRPISLSEISEWMIEATISTEDASFYENNGLNMRGLVRAGVENFLPVSGDFLEGTGGSSITQQLAKNVYIPAEQRAERSIDRKVRETVIALELTEKYSKDQILEWYLNSISYGSIYTGVQAAAQGYFAKDASQLTLAEAALLAGIPQSPSLYAPLQGEQLNPEDSQRLAESSPTRLRQLQVLDLMVRHGVITEEQRDEAAAQEIVFRSSEIEIEAPHFVVNRVQQEIINRWGRDALFNDGLEVITTIDLELQNRALEVLEHWISTEGVPANLHNSAMVAMDVNTGQILVYIGSRDYWDDEIEGKNDMVTALNSPGSTLKPFTFMTAFTQGWGTGTAILDTPLTIIDPATGTSYTPRDPISVLQGPMTAAKALGNSLNITAVKAIQFAGVDRTVQMLKQVGYTTLDQPHYGPALTVGGVDITLMDQIVGFSVLATNGIMRGQEVTYEPEPGERTVEPVALLRVENFKGEILHEFTEPFEQRVIPAEFPYLVTSILSDGSNQCITYGVCGALALPDGYPSAAKTGTSEPFENSRAIGETWTVGYTPNLVAGVWSGNSDNSKIDGISSTRVSHRSWRDFMVIAHEYLNIEPEPFTRPAGVVEREVCWPSGRLPSEICPQRNRYTSLFAESVLPTNDDEAEGMVDTWWQRVPIDTRTGLRAGDSTPAQFVEERVMLVFPEDEIRGWAAHEWAARNNVALAPTTESSAGQLLVNITSPRETETIFGQLQIQGRADSGDTFERYIVQWGRGTNPTSWVTLQESRTPIRGGTLAVWDTTQLQNGPYVLRVQVDDERRGALYYRVGVNVNNGDQGNQGGPQNQAPFVTLSSPQNSSVVSGVVGVSGFAFSGQLVAVSVEVGQGVSPSEWTEIQRHNQPVTTGPLAVWDTRNFEDGTYTLRVTVMDQALGSTEARVVVVVDN